MRYTEVRARHAGGGRSCRAGDYVLYWMQAYRRRVRNHALDCALRHAEESGKPLVIYEGLPPVRGQVRDMSSANTAKKFRLGPYLAYVDQLGKRTVPPST